MGKARGYARFELEQPREAAIVVFFRIPLVRAVLSVQWGTGGGRGPTLEVYG